MVKIEPKTHDEQYPDMSSNDKKSYPYGTSLDLTDEVAKGAGSESLQVGDTVDVRAKAFVKSKSISERDGSENVEMCLQFTEIDVSGASNDRAKQMYGE